MTAHEPPQPLDANMSALWALDPTIHFLNHGCFGARPKSVVNAQIRLREEFEANPFDLLDRRRRELVKGARETLGRFVGAQQQNISFVTNASAGVCSVLRSLRFEPNDELLTTNHLYNAVRMTMKFLAEREGVIAREINVPFPIANPQQVVDAIEAAITPRTRLVIVDHMTSPTALLFPIEKIIQLCDRRGIDVLVDGAHVPGMFELNIEKLNPAYYAGNLHKWVCAPPGAAFLWVRPDKQKGIHPPVLSHFVDEDFAEEFQWQGTRDISPWLCVGDAVEFFEHFGWNRVRQHNHQMAVWARQMLSNKWEVEPTSPMDGSMIGSMATIVLPAHVKTKFATAMEMQTALWHRWQIEAPIVDWGGLWWLRVSCQIYNRAEQYELLGDAVLELLL